MSETVSIDQSVLHLRLKEPRPYTRSVSSRSRVGRGSDVDGSWQFLRLRGLRYHSRAGAVMLISAQISLFRSSQG